MEGSHIAKYGRSKEKRSDCKIVVLAAVVNTEGLLVRTRIFEGNASDCSTMQEIIASLANEQLNRGKDKKDIIVVMDAGISTKENLKYLDENGYKYITVARSSTIKYKSAGKPTREVTDNKKQIIKLERVSVDGDDSHYLLVDSKAKTLKERSMYERACQEYEDGLKTIAEGIRKKGGTKKLDKVYERLGRLKERCHAVAQYYEVSEEHDDNNTVISFTWFKKPEKSLSSESKHGKYVLRTNMDMQDEVNIWEFYNVIRVVESTFRCLKTDLDLRPVYHKGDDGTKAHLHLAILAYWVVSIVQYQLRQQNVHTDWRDIVRILSTHKVVSTEMQRKEKSDVKIRQCTESEEKVQTIYRMLDINNIPIRKRKYVVHPNDDSKKYLLKNRKLNQNKWQCGLIDFTYNPLTTLFFAFDKMTPSNNGTIDDYVSIYRINYDQPCFCSIQDVNMNGALNLEKELQKLDIQISKIYTSSVTTSIANLNYTDYSSLDYILIHGDKMGITNISIPLLGFTCIYNITNSNLKNQEGLFILNTSEDKSLGELLRERHRLSPL